jgi:hypothetical protein
MSDPNPPSHWDLLSSILGATPSPEAAEPRQPSRPPSKKPAPRASHHQRPAAPSRPADWDKLANALGLPPAPAPAVSPPAPVMPPPARSAPPPARSAAAPPPLPGQSHRGSPAPEAPEGSPNFFDERFDFDEPFDLLESSESASPPAEASEQTTESAEGRPRRRHRRRRGRNGGRRDSREAGAPAAPDDRSAHRDAASVEGDLDRASSAEEPEGVRTERALEEAEGGEAQQRRSRRRRPRHGRKRREGEPTAGAGAPVEAGADSASPEPDDADETAADLLAEEDLEMGPAEEGGEGGEERLPRLGFRGLPTWEEAVGLLVSKNVEARAKRPNAGARHGRDNRGPRNNRGRGDKPRRS